MYGFNVDSLNQWWTLNMDGATKPYWVLHRGAGGKPGPTIANYGTDDVNASWTALVETINNCIGQGVQEFWIVCRPGGMNDTKGKVETQLRANGFQSYGAQPQQYGIAGMGNTLPAAPAVDIAGIKAELEEKYRLQNEIAIQKLRHDTQMERMEEMIESIAKSKQSNFDRFLETLNNPEVAQGVIGFIGTLKTLITPVNPVAAMPNIGNTATAPKARKPKVYEIPNDEPEPVPASQPETEDEPEPQGPELFEELAGEYDAAIEAVNMLHQAGWEQPGELLQRVAVFAVNNPQMAQNLLTNL